MAICASATIALAVSGNTVLAILAGLVLFLIGGSIVARRLPAIKELPWRGIRHPVKPRFTFGDSTDLTVRLTGGVK